MRILLQHKIFMGYFLLMAIIGSMVAIVPQFGIRNSL